MYAHFYGLKERPFGVTPDARFFFPSEKHTEALNSLIYTINEQKGFAVITGEIGAGKTTVWHTMLGKLDAGTKIALITNTHLTPKQMIMAILEDFEVPFKDKWTKVRLHFLLNKFLLEQASLGFNVVVVIDEAQNLNLDTLEEVRMLSNLETDREKLLQIILMGQPELRELLELEGMEQIKQRINIYYHIAPLEKEETKNYIEHRLKVAGLNNGRVIFDDSAIEKIYQASGGIPRLINSICDRALLTGYVQEKNIIGQEVIAEVADELQIQKSTLVNG